MLQVLDAAAVRRWCAAAAHGPGRRPRRDRRPQRLPGARRRHRHQPAADHGGGRRRPSHAAPRDLAATVAGDGPRRAHGRPRQLRRHPLASCCAGWPRCSAAAETCPAPSCQRALTRAAELGYAAVADARRGHPAHRRARVRRGRRRARRADLAAVVARGRARPPPASLARTPDLLPQLKAAGVVDAGGRGLCVLLEALERVVTGGRGRGAARRRSCSCRATAPALAAAREAGSDEFALRGAVPPARRGRRRRRGGCKAVARRRSATRSSSSAATGCTTCTCTSTTSAPRVEAGRRGRPAVPHHRHPLRRPGRRRAGLPVMNERPVGRAVVAVAPGRRAGRAVRARPGAVVVDGGPTANPSTAELLDAVRAGRRPPRWCCCPTTATRSPSLAPPPRPPATRACRSPSSRPARSLQGLAALAVADADAGRSPTTSPRWPRRPARPAGPRSPRRCARPPPWPGICRPGDVARPARGRRRAHRRRRRAGRARAARRGCSPAAASSSRVVTGADAADGRSASGCASTSSRATRRSRSSSTRAGSRTTRCCSGVE